MHLSQGLKFYHTVCIAVKPFPLQTCNSNGWQPSGDRLLRNLFHLMLLSHPANEFVSMTDKDCRDAF